MTLVKLIVVGPTAIMSFAMVLVTAIVISMAAAIKGTGIMENKKKLQFHSANFRTARANTLNCTLCISKLICAANVFLFFDQFFKNAIFSIF